jgi:hypothetical protein
LVLVLDSDFNIFDLFALLDLPEPQIADVMLRERMRELNVAPLEVLLYFSHFRAPKGDAIDLLLGTLCELYKDDPGLQRWLPNQMLCSGEEVEVNSANWPRESSAVGPERGGTMIGTAFRSTRSSEMESLTEIPINSPLLFRGWHECEFESGYFRWMAETASIANPNIERPIKSVVLRLRSVYGASEPMLACRFDGEAGAVRIEEAPDSQWIVHCEPTSKDIAVKVVDIDALVSDSPAIAEGKSDHRRLSICLTGVTYAFA